MTKLQEMLLLALTEFDALCKAQGLTYYMLGGTMLGAYRHQGFIPWDDDVDIGMPRADYEKLLRLPKEKLPVGYEIRHFSREANIPYAFAHFENSNTTYLEARRSGGGYIGGVYLEIFPLDEAGTEAGRKTRMERKTRFLKRLLYVSTLKRQEKKRSLLKRSIIRLLLLVTATDRLTRRLDRVLKRQGGTGAYSNYLGHWGSRETIEKECFCVEPAGEPVRYLFEGHAFCGVKEPVRYLTALYGADFMTPPGEAERKAGEHPASVVDFTLPYRQYGEKEEKGD